jgi:LDH2 family malate/lactate/ureidoglycolate dehydrogenase
MPAGGHKGYALALMVEILSNALGGADEPETTGPTGDMSGSFFLAIDPTVFRPFASYSRSVERLTERVTAVRPAPGFTEVLLPGDPELRTRAERASSVPLPEATVEAINAAAAVFGVPPLQH